MNRTDQPSIAREGELPEAFAPRAFLVHGSFEGPEEGGPPGSSAIKENTRGAVRALLRWGGHKTSGRGRPASESLAKAIDDDRWPTIHPLVDECNRLSVLSGLPISVLDTALLKGSLSLRVGAPGEEYAFNPSGQVLSLKGLLLVADDDGPTGSPVKDAQRSKVSSETRGFLVLVWGTAVVPEATERVENGLGLWCSDRSAALQLLEIS